MRPSACWRGALATRKAGVKAMKKCNLAVSLASVLLGCLALYLSAGLSGYDEYGVPGERY